MPSADGLRPFSVGDLIVARFRRERVPFGGTPEWNKHALTFSPRNYEKYLTSAARYTYNADGSVASVTNELGHVTQVTAHNGRGQPTTVIDANGITTQLAYDALGRLTGTTVEPGTVRSALTAIEYDAVGQMTKITRPDGAFLAYTYSNAKRLTQVQASDGEAITYTHDLMGNVTSRTMAWPDTTVTFSQTQTFDELGRLLTQIGANTRTTTYSYEKNDNLKSVTDPRSNVYAYAYDGLNRLMQETDQEGAQVTYTRDGRDNVTTYKDPRNLQTTYVRNGFDEVIRQTSPDSGITDYVRDARGDVTQVNDARGIVTATTYDNTGRILSKSYPSSPSENAVYTYDATTGGNKGIGRLTGVTHPGGSVATTYDTRGNITAEVRTIAGVAHTVAYAYDLADKLTGLTYPSGREVRGGYQGIRGDWFAPDCPHSHVHTPYSKTRWSRGNVANLCGRARRLLDKVESNL